MKKWKIEINILIGFLMLLLLTGLIVWTLIQLNLYKPAGLLGDLLAPEHAPCLACDPPKPYWYRMLPVLIIIITDYILVRYLVWRVVKLIKNS